MTRQEVLTAFHAGDIGDVEFFELALEAGVPLAEIEKALEERADEL
jgi:hypothetical protein